MIFTTFASSGLRISAMQTVAPRWTRYLAVASPMPRAPPVMVITLVEKGRAMVVSFKQARLCSFRHPPNLRHALGNPAKGVIGEITKA